MKRFGAKVLAATATATATMAAAGMPAAAAGAPSARAATQHWLHTDTLAALDRTKDPAERAGVYRGMNERLQADDEDETTQDATMRALFAAYVPLIVHLRKDLATSDPQLCVAVAFGEPAAYAATHLRNTIGLLATRPPTDLGRLRPALRLVTSCTRPS